MTVYRQHRCSEEKLPAGQVHCAWCQCLSRCEGQYPGDRGCLQPPWQRGDGGWAEVAESTLPPEIEACAIRCQNESEFVGGSEGHPGLSGGGQGGNEWVCQELRPEAPSLHVHRGKVETREGPSSASDVGPVMPVSRSSPLLTDPTARHWGPCIGQTQEEGIAVFKKQLWPSESAWKEFWHKARTQLMA